MHAILHNLAFLVAGALVTSLAEYLFKYNLVDLLKDKVVGLFKKAEADVKSKI